MSYNMTNELQNLSKEMFPYPLKMIRWLTEFESFVNKFLFPFPSPLEVTGGSNKMCGVQNELMELCFRTLAR